MLQIKIPDEVIELHRCYMYRNVMPKLRYERKKLNGNYNWCINMRLFLKDIEDDFDTLAVGQCDCLYRISDQLSSSYNNLLSINKKLTKKVLKKIFNYDNFLRLSEFDALKECLKHSTESSLKDDCVTRAEYSKTKRLTNKNFKGYLKKYLNQCAGCENIVLPENELDIKQWESWFKSTVIADLQQTGFHDSLLKKMKIWTPYVFAMYFGARVCPYCNRQYITTLLTDAAKARAGIDHFKPKSKYPWLALSLYNMVLSCKTCNSSLKKTLDTVWNPYASSIAENFRFEGEFNSDGDYFINVKLDKGKVATESYLDRFKIREVMQNHVDVVKEYRQKQLAYSDAYMDSVLQNTQNLFNSKEDMKAAVFGYVPREEDIDRVALGKLHYDLAKEFGLIVNDTDK